MCLLGGFNLAQASDWHKINETPSVFNPIASKLNMYSWFYSYEGKALGNEEILKDQLTDLTLKLRSSSLNLTEQDIDISVYPSNQYYEPLLALGYLDSPAPFQGSYVEEINTFVDSGSFDIFEGVDSSKKHQCATIYLYSRDQAQLALFSACSSEDR